MHRIYILEQPMETGNNHNITIAPLSPRDAFVALMKHPYRLEIGIHERLRKEFDVIGRVLKLIAVRSMTYPRDYALLPNVCEAILSDLGADV